MMRWFYDLFGKDEDKRYEYRIVRYPKQEKHTEQDKRYDACAQKAVTEKDWEMAMLMFPRWADNDWRWTAEYRVNKEASWIELGVFDRDYSAKMACEDHAKKRAAPKVTYLGRLP